jgi:hypothetical protein
LSQAPLSISGAVAVMEPAPASRDGPA